MPKAGKSGLGVQIPTFAYEAFESVRERYADVHHVTPTQPLAIAALIHDLDVEELEAALKAYRAACKARGIKPG